jgi:amidase
VGEVLFGETLPAALPRRLVIAVDAFGFADLDVQAALAPMVEKLASLIGDVAEEVLAPQGLSVWQRSQRVLQSSESAQTFAPWLDEQNPRLAWSVARGLVLGSMFTETERNAAALMRLEARARLRFLVPAGTILCLPTTPFPAPLRGLPVSALAFPRERISCLTSHGGLTGVPQVSIPGALVDGAPVGLSIVGARGSDVSLLAVARALAGG